MKRKNADNCIRSGQRNKPGGDNRGLSLVEVIVAMLVLAIIVVPMLDMFGNATKTNVQASGKQYANSVLENTMEEIRAKNYILVYDAVDPGNCDWRDPGTGKLCLYTGEEDNGELSGKTFTGTVMQGNREYRVKVTLDADEYRGIGNGLNDYRMPNISGYDSTDCEMVMLDGGSDAIIVEEFYRQYEMQEAAEYQARVNAEWMESEEYLFRYEFDKWIEWWEKKNGVGTAPEEGYFPPLFNESSVWRASLVDLATFKNCVRKRTDLNVVPTGTGEYTVQYTVYYYVNQSAVSLGLTGTFNESYEYSSGSGTYFTADKLKNLYVFYQPFTADMSQEKLVINVEKIMGEEDWKCRLYLAVQGTPTGEQLDVELLLDNTVPTQDMYDRLQIQAAANVECREYNINSGDLISTLAPQDMVYRVTIEVMQPETGEVLTSTESVIYQE